MLDALADPFSAGIMQRALLEVLLLGVVGGALGCWIVLGELSYGAESLAHGMFPGLVLAALAGVPLLLGGAAGILVAALAVALAGRVPGDRARQRRPRSPSRRCSASACCSRSRPTSPPGIQGLLFGDVLGTTRGRPARRRGARGGGAGRAAADALAPARGRLRPRRRARRSASRRCSSTRVLLTLLALAVLVAVQGLGNLLVVAVLVAPAAAARLL